MRLASSKVFEVGRGDDEVDEAEVVGRLRVDHVARQDQLHRLTLADESREALGSAAAGDDAEVDLGLAEARRLARDADVARERQLAAAAETEAVNHGDDGLGEGIDGGEERAPGHHVALRDGGAPLELTDVGARDESLLARAGDDDDADGLVLAQLFERGRALGARLDVECVELLRPVDRDDGDAPAPLDQKCLV
jgi:hypothetical protein